MRSFLFAVVAINLSSVVAGDPDPLRTAIARGLDFVAKDSIRWREEHTCAACHHAALAVWAFRDAQAQGIAVDETLLAELNQQMSAAGDGRFIGERPADRPEALNTKALYFALALSRNPDATALSHDGTKLLMATVIDDQTDDGSWSIWPETRPPIFLRSDDAATSLAVLTLQPFAAAGDADAVAAREQGVAWLAEHAPDDDPQTLALRTILWRTLDRPQAESQPWLDIIRSRQQADGGWSQAPDMPSDAWATGQALYALSLSGAESDDPSIVNGRQFLISTQREDGSWPMTSRPIKPDGEGSGSLIPIIGGGSAWGVLGLIRSTHQ